MDWQRHWQWREFLDTMGLEVQGTLGKDTKAVELFREQIATFARMREARARAIADDQRERIEHWQRVKGNPRLRKKTAHFSKEGLVWNDVRFETTRECVPTTENAAEIQYRLDGRRNSFPATGGPGHEMPADHADEYVARLTRWIAENSGQITERHSDGEIPAAVIQVRGVGQLREVPQDEPEGMRRELAIVQAQIPGIRDKKTSWVYTSRPWWQWLGQEEEDVFGYWRLPAKKLPPDVDAWLDKTPGSNPPTARLPTLDKTEAEIRRYVIVTGLHDRIIVDPDRRISAGIWSDDLQSMVKGGLEEGEKYGLSESVLKCTWNEVRGDLQKHAQAPKGNGLGGEPKMKAGTPRRKAASDDRPKQRGRPRKHTDAKCKKALMQFEDLYANSNDATGAWNTVAGNLDFKSGEAARKACERYEQSQHSGQNGQK